MQLPQNKRIKYILKQVVNFYPNIGDYRDISSTIFSNTLQFVDIDSVNERIDFFRNTKWYLYYFDSQSSQIARVLIIFKQNGRLEIQKHGINADNYLGEYKFFGDIRVLLLHKKSENSQSLQILINANVGKKQNLAVGAWQNFNSKTIKSGTLILERIENEDEIQAKLRIFESYENFKKECPMEIVRFFSAEQNYFFQIPGNIFSLSNLKREIKKDTLKSITNIYSQFEFYIESSLADFSVSQLKKEIMSLHDFAADRIVIHSCTNDLPNIKRGFPREFKKSAAYILICETISPAQYLRLGYALQDRKKLYIFSVNENLELTNEFVSHFANTLNIDEIAEILDVGEI